MKATLLAIALLLMVSGPMDARNKRHKRSGYSVQGYVDVGPRYGGSFYFGTRPYYGYGGSFQYRPRYRNYGPSYRPYAPSYGHSYWKKCKCKPCKKYRKYLKKRHKHHRDRYYHRHYR